MRHSTAIALLFIASTAAQAQTMTLAECIRTGIDNNLRLANARTEMLKSHTRVAQSRSRLLPTVNGTAQFTDYLKRPVNVTTGTLLGNDFPDDPTWQVIRSMKYNASAGVQLAMPLYDQTILASIDAARTVERISALSYEEAKEELTVQIAKVYYLAQASQEQQRLADENIIRMEKLCAITEALHEQGVVTETDLNRVRISLETLRTQSGQHRTLYEQQINTLHFLMDSSCDTPLTVMAMPETVSPAPVSGISNTLPALLAAATQKELAEKHISTVRAGYLPTLSLTGYAGGIGYHERLKDFTDNWFGHSHLSLTLRIPIFDANSKRLQIKQYKYEAEQAANQQALLQKQLNEQYASARLQLSHNIEVLHTQTECRRQAEDVYNMTEEQYKEGVASMTDLLQDEMQLRTVQAACVQAHLQCFLAKLDLMRMSGCLDQLTRQQ